MVLAQDLERLIRWWCALVRESIDALLSCCHPDWPVSLRASFLNERASWRGPVGRSPLWPTEALSVLQSSPGEPAPPPRSAPCLPSHREPLSALSWIARQLGRVPSNGQAMSPPCPGAGDAPMGPRQITSDQEIAHHQSEVMRIAPIARPRRPSCRRIDACFSRPGAECLTAPR